MAQLNEQRNTLLAGTGEVHIQGSGAKPYVLKNVGGIFSCTCPAWRNQGKPIDKRSCKHLIAVLGVENERERVDNDSLVVAKLDAQASAAADKQPGWAMLAETWAGEDMTGWWQSEKLDGVRAMWTGKGFFTRQGNPIYAPDWFTADFPTFMLDGELWMGRGKFQDTVSIVRSQDAGDRWANVFYMVFDAPMSNVKWEDRLGELGKQVGKAKLTPMAEVERFAKKAFVLPQFKVQSMNDVHAKMDEVIAKQGEGLMFKKPGSLYKAHRSPALLKMKRFETDEAVVLDKLEGTGKFAGMLGALKVRNRQGAVFAVGSGFTEQARNNLWKSVVSPPVGRIIEFKYQGLSKDGIPRFPTFKHFREDMTQENWKQNWTGTTS